MRKILSLALCLMLMLTVVPASAESTMPLTVDTDHLQVVKALGIMDAFSNNDSDADYVSRGEFASVICKLINMNDLQTSHKPEFDDVNEGHVYYNQIATVSSQKIMIGNSDGNFMPNANITYVQAVKCLLYILGYEVHAEKNGGYPIGYTLQASKLDILENINYDQDKFISRAELAQLVYNCLDVELIEVTNVSEDSSYREKTGETILSKYLNVRKFEAVVNSVDGRSMLSRQKDTSEGTVKIGSTVLKYTDSYVPSLLGYRVEAYATAGNGAESLIYAFATGKNSELMIKVDKLNLDSSDFTLKNFSYEDETGKTINAKLTDNHRFIYNGVYDLDFDLDDLNFATGYVKLVDHDDDEVYDVCFIWDYENYVCQSVSEEVITCHYKKTLRKDTSGDVTYHVLGNDGIWGGWDMLLKSSNWDVLSVARSKDGSLVTIIPTRSGIGGTVEAVSEDNGAKYAQINGYEYKISDNYLNLPENTGYIPVKSGLRSEFYFDVVGEIAAVYAVGSDEEFYAYAINVAQKGSMTKTYEIKLFDHNGKIQIYDIADKVRFSSDTLDAKTYKTNEVMTLFFDGVGNFVQQMICYRVDENNVVTSIRKAADATVLGYNLDKFSMDFDTMNSSETYCFQNATSSFIHESLYNQVFHLAGTTKVFYLPCENGEAIEDEMQIVDSSIFENGDDYSNMQVFDCDDTYTASVLLYMPDDSGDSDVTVLDSYFFAVNDVYMGKDKDGNFQPMVKGMLRGVEEEFIYTSLDGTVPEKGSIIQCQKTLKGELKIHADYVIYSPSQGATITARNTIKGSGQFPTIWSQVGRLWRMNGSAISVYVGDERPWASYMNGSVIYKYSDDTNRYEQVDESSLIQSTGSPMSIADGSLMVLNYRYHYVREIFIIE